MPPESTTGRLRADAQRNRERIITVAREQFSTHGVSASLDAIAKKAGVGAGTLYRNFPNREALLSAVLNASDDTLKARREDIQSRTAGASERLEQWLRALIDWAGTVEGLPGPLCAASPHDKTPLGITCQDCISWTTEFLEAAQQEGTARLDIRARDLFLAALAISWVHNASVADEHSPAALTTLCANGWRTR